MAESARDKVAPPRSDVFISYSRKDREFVKRLEVELQRRGREAWVDWEGIRPAEEFMQAIFPAIEGTDTFVFVLSPDSVSSEICGRELAHAVSHNKRMIPIMARDVEAKAVPEPLAKLNWVFARDADSFEAAADFLISALDTDLDWVHAHTRLLTRAIEWEAKGKSNSFVLRGEDLRAAEQWLAQAGTEKERQPTALQTEYIIASRKATVRRQRIIVGALALGLLVAIVLALLAWSQRNQARQQAQIASAGRLAGFGLSFLRDQLPLSLLLGVEAYRTADTVEARNTLLLALQTEPGLVTFLHGHSGPVESLVFSPDGQTLVSGGADGTVRLWDLQQRRQLGLPLHQFKARADDGGNSVHSLCYSPDGASLAAGTMEGDLSIWNLASRKLQAEEVFGGTVNSVAFSPDSKSVAVSSVVNFTLLNAATLERIGEPILGLGATWIPQVGAGTPECVAFSPDGKTLAFDVREELWLWEIATRKPLAHFTGHADWITKIAYSPDGKIIVSGDRGGAIRLWDAESRKPMGGPITGRSGWVSHIAFSADSKILFWGGTDGVVQHYDMERAVLVGQPIVVGPFSSLAVSPDSSRLAVGARDGTIRMWDVKASPLLGAEISTNRTWSVAFSQDGSLLAVAGEAVEIFNARTGQTLGTLEFWDKVRSLAFVGPSHTLALGCENGMVRFWNADSSKPIGEPLQAHKTDSYVWSLASTPDGKTLASGGSDGTLRFCDPQTRTQIGAPITAHGGDVYSVAFNSTGTMLASGGEDKTVRLWDARTRQAMGAPLQGHLDSVWSVAFDPKGNVLASGDNKGTLLLWDVASRARRGEPVPGFVSRIASLAFSPDGGTLAAAAFSGTLRFVDVESRQPLGNPVFAEGEHYSVNAVTYSPDGNALAAGLNNPPGLFLLDASPDAWRARAGRRANRNLSLPEWKRFFGVQPYRRTFAELPAGEGAPQD
jgi:WD40 repeat protein